MVTRFGQVSPNPCQVRLNAQLTETINTDIITHDVHRTSVTLDARLCSLRSVSRRYVTSMQHLVRYTVIRKKMLPIGINCDYQCVLGSLVSAGTYRSQKACLQFRLHRDHPDPANGMKFQIPVTRLQKQDLTG